MIFKSANYFFQMVDAVDHLLNDAVDLHAQAVDQQQNLATIAEFRHWSESASARIWKFLPESDSVRLPLPDSSYTLPERQGSDQNRFGQIQPESDTNGQISATLKIIQILKKYDYC
jgi:hypothetical protein